MKKFCVVNFVGVDLVEAVPCSWVIGDFCFWPTKSTVASIFPILARPLPNDGDKDAATARGLRNFSALRLSLWALHGPPIILYWEMPPAHLQQLQFGHLLPGNRPSAIAMLLLLA